MSQRLRENLHLIFNCHRAFEKGKKVKRYLVNIRGNNSRNKKKRHTQRRPIVARSIMWRRKMADKKIAQKEDIRDMWHVNLTVKRKFCAVSRVPASIGEGASISASEGAVSWKDMMSWKVWCPVWVCRRRSKREGCDGRGGLYAELSKHA
jgi:hypothetical protein